MLLLVAAIAAGLAAGYLVATQGTLGQGQADYYCYELRQARICTYTRSECERRLAREELSDMQSRCTPHTNDAPSP